MPLSAGSKLGPYDILALIGAGGMGEVYRAFDPRLGRDVAIKVLPAAVASDPERLARFQREARSLAALNHPHIVTIFSVEEVDGIQFLTMELIEGHTLAQWIPAGGLPCEQFVGIAADLADALAAAHERGIVHRDLKPANVMVTADGRVKVLDFGLARDLRGTAAEDVTAISLDNTRAGVVLGTVAYMSPEQISGAPVDHRTDIFSLGILLHEMASGRNPFVGQSSAERMSSILRDPPSSISELRPDLPSDLSRVVRRCMEKDPRRRIQTARDVSNEIRDLDREASSQPSNPVLAVPFSGGAQTQIDKGSSGGITPPTTNQTRFSTYWMRGAIASVFLAAALAGAYWYLGRPLPPPRITEYLQVTHDGHIKLLRGTDGSRLYFTEFESTTIAQVSATGGEIVPIPIAKPSSATLRDVSPDGSSFLVASDEKGNPYSVLWSVRILGGSARRLCSFVEAAYSPDGGTIAYSTAEGDIWLVGSDGAGAHKLAHVGGIAYAIAWSPGRSTIAFSKDEKLWEISSSGSNLREVLPGWNKEGFKVGGRWTPDGKFLLFHAGGPTIGWVNQIWALDERRGLLRKPPTEPEQLTTGPINWGRPFPAKDGKKIFVEGITEHGELVRLEPRTKQLQPFLGGKSIQGVAFSKDGKFVAYVTYPEKRLWKANQDGTDPIQLADDSMGVFLPRWSPDGKKILFTDENPQTTPIYVISSDGGTPQKLLPDDTRAEEDPNWSLDGHRIVFASGRLSNVGEKIDIRILDLDTHQVTTVPGSENLLSPRWSPDGRFLAALPFDGLGLKIFDFKTGRWTVLEEGARVDYPAWSRDSTMIYFERLGGGAGLFRIPVQGGVEERIYDLKDWHGVLWMGLDPTDAPMLLRDTGSDDIYALTMEVK